MNNNIKFRFVTRTVTTDYRVFYDNGNKELSDVDEFVPLREKCRIIPEEGLAVALFEENNKIFLTASGLKFGKTDRAGRPIRFSFCQIFDNKQGRERAFSAFKMLVLSTHDVSAKIRELIKEIPVKKINSQGREIMSENISFDDEEFMDFLQRYSKSKSSVNSKFKTAENGKSYDSGSCVWPSKGCILKWIEAEPDVISCYKIVGRDKNNSKRTGNGNNIKAVCAVIAFAVIAGAAGAGIYYYKSNHELTKKEFESQPQVGLNNITSSDNVISLDNVISTDNKSSFDNIGGKK